MMHIPSQFSCIQHVTTAERASNPLPVFIILSDPRERDVVIVVEVVDVSLFNCNGRVVEYFSENNKNICHVQYRRRAAFVVIRVLARDAR